MAKKKKQDAAVAEGEAPAEKKSLLKNKKLLLILVIVLALLGGGGLGAFLIFGSSGNNDQETVAKAEHGQDENMDKGENHEGEKDAHGEKAPEHEPAKEAANVFDHVYVMAPMEISLKDGNKTLMVSIRLELDHPELAVEFNDRKDMIHGAIRSILAAKTMAELEGAEAKIRLKMALVTELNRRLETGKVRNIYFTDYLII